MWHELAYLMRLDKPIGTLLLLWPTLWGLWLASHGAPDLTLILIFVSGVFLMRSAGCIINDIADRHVDRYVLRTRNRPLAAKRISTRIALIAAILLSSLAYLLIQTLNPFTIQLAWLGLLLAIIYPFLKRISHLPQVGLGLAFAFGIPMAFAAVQNAIPHQAWCLYLAAMIWTIIYDTQYAMVDREDDLQIGIKSTAILFGEYDIPIIVSLQCLFLINMIISGYFFELRAPFYLSLLWVLLLFVYQSILLRSRTSANYFKAFKNNQWVGFIIFLGCVL